MNTERVVKAETNRWSDGYLRVLMPLVIGQQLKKYLSNTPIGEVVEQYRGQRWYCSTCNKPQLKFCQI